MVVGLGSGGGAGTQERGYEGRAGGGGSVAGVGDDEDGGGDED